MPANKPNVAARAQLTHAVVEAVNRTAEDLRRGQRVDTRLLSDQDSVVDRNRAATADAVSLASVEELVSELDGLRTAMQTRAVIEQAKGMLMLRHRCDQDAAFFILVRASQQMQIKLRDVAQHVVEWGSGYSAN